MIKRVMIAAIALCVACSANAATVRFKQYTHPSTEEFRPFNKIYLEGVMEGFVTSNSSLIVDGKPPLFCLPPKLAVTGEQAEDIKMRKAKALSNIDDAPISILLLEGLKETFPCGGPGK
jgi:Rap1a immunity proteins